MDFSIYRLLKDLPGRTVEKFLHKSRNATDLWSLKVDQIKNSSRFYEKRISLHWLGDAGKNHCQSTQMVDVSSNARWLAAGIDILQHWEWELTWTDLRHQRHNIFLVQSSLHFKQLFRNETEDIGKQLLHFKNQKTLRVLFPFGSCLFLKSCRIIYSIKMLMPYVALTTHTY